MGGSSSRELEAAQHQVRKLTKELERATRKASLGGANVLKQQSAAQAAAVAAVEQRLQAELQAKDKELKGVAAELPKIKQEATLAKEKLQQAKQAQVRKETELTALQKELRASKEELEALFGKLKFSEAEGAAARKLKAELSEEKRALAMQQQAAAEESARAIADANAAILAEESSIAQQQQQQYGGTEAAGAEAVVVHHPVFGRLLHDYGHKRLYLGSPTTLWAGTVLWERQRAFRQERASLIATAKGRGQSRGWPGSISIVEMSDGAADGSDAGAGAGKRGRGRPSKASVEEAATGEGGGEGGGGSGRPSLGMLIDGQHRLGAAHLLSQRGKLEGPLASILVEVYPPMEEGGIKELFTEINKAEPVLLVDLPEGGASESDNAVLTIAAEELRERYPDMFKPSHGCRPPHINVDVLREELHRAEILQRERLTSAEQLVGWIEARNEELAGRAEGEWSAGAARVKSGAALEKALAKAKDQNFYLGLTWEWVRNGKE